MKHFLGLATESRRLFMNFTRLNALVSGNFTITKGRRERGYIDERRFYSAGTICANRFIYHGRPHSWFKNQCIWNYSHVVHLWSWFQKSKSLSSTKANKSSPIPIVISQRMFSVLYTGSGIIESVIHPGWSIVVTGPMPHVRSSLLAVTSCTAGFHIPALFGILLSGQLHQIQILLPVVSMACVDL